MAAMAAAGRADAVVDLDEAFHEDLWAIADHQLLLRWPPACAAGSSASCERRPCRCRRTRSARTPSRTSCCSNAVASGDPERAEREVERHVSLATARIRAALLET